MPRAKYFHSALGKAAPKQKADDCSMSNGFAGLFNIAAKLSSCTLDNRCNSVCAIDWPLANLFEGGTSNPLFHVHGELAPAVAEIWKSWTGLGTSSDNLQGKKTMWVGYAMSSVTHSRDDPSTNQHEERGMSTNSGWTPCEICSSFAQPDIQLESN